MQQQTSGATQNLDNLDAHIPSFEYLCKSTRSLRKHCSRDVIGAKMGFSVWPRAWRISESLWIGYQCPPGRTSPYSMHVGMQGGSCLRRATERGRWNFEKSLLRARRRWSLTENTQEQARQAREPCGDHAIRGGGEDWGGVNRAKQGSGL